jgi:hypothetical protein
MTSLDDGIDLDRKIEDPINRDIKEPTKGENKSEQELEPLRRVK